MKLELFDIIKIICAKASMYFNALLYSMPNTVAY